MELRTYTVNYSKPNGAFAAKYPALADLPFILDGRPRFHRLANAYLVERALGIWGPAGRPGRPTRKTVKSYAEWLANFLEWAERRGIPLVECDYTLHLIGRYQKEMLDGIWSQSGEPLAPTTINARVQQATDLLIWMGEKGLRAPLSVPYTTTKYKASSDVDSQAHLSKTVRRRKGKLNPTYGHLHLPPDTKVKEWLLQVQRRYGTTKSLMCESLLLTAMRREEVTCIRVDTLPLDPEEWQIPNPTAPPHQQSVSITIKYGTKGRSYGEDNGDKIGPSRSILIPLQLAEQWHQYRNDARNLAFANRLKGKTGGDRRAAAKSAVHLFLDEESGLKISGSQLYDAWTGVELPAKGWAPRNGRHWWACSVLWREMKKHENTSPINNETAAALLESTALSIIRLQIQPQLGHGSDQTTMLYLRWAMRMLAVPISIGADDDLEERQT